MTRDCKALTQNGQQPKQCEYEIFVYCYQYFFYRRKQDEYNKKATVDEECFLSHLIMSEISFICLSLDLDAGKVGIGGIEGPSAPGRKQVSELSMFVCVSDVTPRLRSRGMFS